MPKPPQLTSPESIAKKSSTMSDIPPLEQWHLPSSSALISTSESVGRDFWSSVVNGDYSITKNRRMHFESEESAKVNAISYAADASKFGWNKGTRKTVKKTYGDNV